MNSIWNNNIKAFNTRFPNLASIYKDFINSPSEIESQSKKIWTFETAKNGQITASENDLRLHSAYNPEREANSTVNQEEIWKKSTSVFMGFGLGYHVIEWAKKDLLQQNPAEKKLILIEPDPLHFFASLFILDWTPVFKVPNLIIALACPTESIMGLLEDQTQINTGCSGVSDSHFFNIPSFTAHAPEYFNIVKTLIERNKTKNEINAATLKKFGKLWERNCQKNKKQLSLRKSITSIKQEDVKKKCIIVAAGPSLQKVLPHLAELKKEYTIICVETALHSMLRYNVQPDYIILMDPQYWAYKHIEGLHAPESVLITEVSAYPSVFNFDCKDILLCKSQIPFGQKLEQEAGLNFVDLGAGGSVASAAWNFAYFLKAQEIFLAGLDLSYPGKQTHIKGSSAEQKFHTISNRLCSVEKMNTSTLHGISSEYADDYNGQKVLTDARMKMFAWWFESRIASCTDVKTYTLCPGSLRIPGVSVKNLF